MGKSRLDSARGARTGALAAFVLLIAAGLRVFHLDYRSLWTDEFKTLAVLGRPAAEIARERMANGHFPTYFWFLAAWTRIAGTSDFALRLPSAVAGTLAAGMIFLGMRRAAGGSPALWTTFFFALHERAIWASQEARPYAWVLLAAAGAFHALQLVAGGKPRAGWMAFALWSLLGLLSHGTYAFIFLAQIAVVIPWQLARPPRRWAGLFVPLGLTIAGAAAFAFVASHQRNTGKFYGAAGWPEWAKLREAVLQIFWGEYGYFFGSGFKYVGLPLAAGVVYLAWRTRGQTAKPASGGEAEAGFPLIPFALAWAFSALVGRTVFSMTFHMIEGGIRYYAVSLGGASILTGAAVAGLASRKWRGALGLLCAAILATVAWGWLFFRGDGVREAVRTVAASRGPDEPVFFCASADAGVIARHYGLGAEPLIVGRTEADETILRRRLQPAEAASGFWVVLYKGHDSPFAQYLPAWAGERFERVETHRFRMARTIHYRRE